MKLLEKKDKCFVNNAFAAEISLEYICNMVSMESQVKKKQNAFVTFVMRNSKCPRKKKHNMREKSAASFRVVAK